jgi:hypothetical protein
MRSRLRNSPTFSAFVLVGIVALFGLTVAASGAPQKNRPGIDPATDYAPLLKAIRLVESDDNPTPPGSNDNGNALGAYQIHFDYWLDTGLAGKYENVKDTTYATRCVVHYWRRYCPNAIANADFDRLVLTHHCGPSATTGSKERDAEYIQKVKNALRIVLDHGERRRRLTATPDKHNIAIAAD